MKLRRRGLTIEHLWALTVLVGIFVFANTHPIRPHDFWWHIAAGRELAQTGQIPLVDSASQTMAGAPYPAYQTYWLMEWTLYQLYRLGGATLIVLFQTAVVTATYALLLWLARRISGSWRVAALATLFAAAQGLNDWNVRPQTISFLIGALFLNTIDAHRRQSRRWLLALFPIGMVVWVNSHGSFPIGLLLLGLWLVDETWNAFHTGQWRDLLEPALALGVTAGACLLNPRGIGVLGYITAMTSDPIIQNLVTEWLPPTFETLGGQLFLGGLLLSAAVLALSSRRPTPSQLLTFLVFGALGLRTSRGIVWFGLAMAPVLAGHVGKMRVGEGVRGREGERARKRESEEAKRRGAAGEPGREDGERVSQDFGAAIPASQSAIANSRADLGAAIPDPQSAIQALTSAPQSRIANTLNAVLVGLLLLGTVLSLPWFKRLWPLAPEKAGLISAETPVTATEVLLRERPPGPLFHAMSFGSYLIWEAQPEYPVFVDPRIELYPGELWLDYIRISAAIPGWEEQLEGYGIQTLMLSPQEQAGLVTAVRESGEWRTLYEDLAAAIFVRQNN